MSAVGLPCNPSPVSPSGQFRAARRCPAACAMLHAHQPRANRSSSRDLQPELLHSNLTSRCSFRSSSSSSWALAAKPTGKEGALATASPSAVVFNPKDVIIKYYECYNAGDLAGIEPLLAPGVSYHDMIYEEAFEGREAMMKYLRKVVKVVPRDVKFVIDDITDGDPRKVGITWHCECGDGIRFPFSRGASFYVLNDEGQILTARDLVETSTKPGTTALQLIGLLTPLVRKLGPNADPSTLKKLPLAAAAVWAFYAGYTAYVMLSPDAPGPPAYATPPEVIMEVFYESLNFFYINIGLSQLGLSPVPAVTCPPVSEALFNFVNAWSLMALPFMLSDGASRKVGGSGRLVAWWTGIMFLTNVFYIPFLALRAAPEPAATPDDVPPPPPPPTPLPSWAPLFGATSLAVGVFSIGWALVGRPETGGDLAVRWQYFVDTYSSNRVFFAFVVDACLYSVWQAVLMGEAAPARYRLVPFFGMAAYLLQGGKVQEGEEAA